MSRGGVQVIRQRGGFNGDEMTCPVVMSCKTELNIDGEGLWHWNNGYVAPDGNFFEQRLSCFAREDFQLKSEIDIG